MGYEGKRRAVEELQSGKTKAKQNETNDSSKNDVRSDGLKSIIELILNLPARLCNKWMAASELRRCLIDGGVVQQAVTTEDVNDAIRLYGKGRLTLNRARLYGERERYYRNTLIDDNETPATQHRPAEEYEDYFAQEYGAELRKVRAMAVDKSSRGRKRRRRSDANDTSTTGDNSTAAAGDGGGSTENSASSGNKCDKDDVDSASAEELQIEKEQAAKKRKKPKKNSWKPRTFSWKEMA